MRKILRKTGMPAVLAIAAMMMCPLSIQAQRHDFANFNRYA